MQIPGLRGLGPFALARESIKDFLDDDMLTYASALAYQVLFSLFPFIIFLIAVVGSLDVPGFFEWVRQQAQLVLPGQAMEEVNKVISEVRQPQGGLLSFGAIIALWSASSGIRALMHALNVAYDVGEGRPAWKLYPLSVFYTIGVAAMLVAAAAFLILGPEVVQWLAQQIGLEHLFVTIWAWLRWPVILLLFMMAIAVVYYVAPDVEQTFRFITPGATLAVIVWIAASLGFNWYLQSFAHFNVMYGSIGTIIALLLYFFISSAVLLFGAEINAVIEQHAPGGKRPGEKKLPENPRKNDRDQHARGK